MAHLAGAQEGGFPYSSKAMAGGVAHDNNMLGVILGYAALPSGRLPAGDPLPGCLQEIERAALRSRDLTGQLLARELMRRAEAIRPGIRVLLMSGYPANVIAHHGLLDAGIRFIQKPFGMDDLARKVRHAVTGG